MSDSYKRKQGFWAAAQSVDERLEQAIRILKAEAWRPSKRIKASRPDLDGRLIPRAGYHLHTSLDGTRLVCEPPEAHDLKGQVTKDHGLYMHVVEPSQPRLAMKRPVIRKRAKAGTRITSKPNTRRKRGR